MNERLFIYFVLCAKQLFMSCETSYLLMITIAAPSCVTQVSSSATTFSELADEAWYWPKRVLRSG